LLKILEKLPEPTVKTGEKKQRWPWDPDIASGMWWIEALETIVPIVR